MPVAPSFQKMEILCSPFLENKKQYVRIRNPKTGTERKVRWYSDIEYNKLYPEQKTTVQDKYYKSQKEIMGFGEKEYIIIFQGITQENEEFFRQGPFRNSRWWGWYFISSFDSLPILPDGVSALKLPWSIVGEDDSKLKSENLVTTAVKKLLKEGK